MYSDIAKNASCTYISTFQDQVWHAITAHTRGRYTSNQQLYDLMYTGWRNITATLSTLYLPPKERFANLIELQAKYLLTLMVSLCIIPYIAINNDMFRPYKAINCCVSD